MSAKKKGGYDDILRMQHYDKLVKKIDEKQKHIRLQFNLFIWNINIVTIKLDSIENVCPAAFWQNKIYI